MCQCGVYVSVHKWCVCQYGVYVSVDMWGVCVGVSVVCM